ncbi:MAG: hypothetical protein NVSMB19_18010 [Vulcanimicrobiaceae bacterium]
MNVRSIALAVLWSGAGSAAVAATSPLREIGHTAITEDICANVVVHANSAIAATLRDDERLVRAVARLRGTDFDDANPGRRAAVAELARLAADVNASALHGGSEVARLVALADAAPRDHAADLRIFASALGTALERQSRMSSELDGFIGRLDVRDLRVAPGSVAATVLEPVEGSRGLARGIGAPPQRPSFAQRPTAPLAMAHAVARDFETRLDANARDEARAAERAEAAVTGC